MAVGAEPKSLGGLFGGWGRGDTREHLICHTTLQKRGVWVRIGKKELRGMIYSYFMHICVLPACISVCLYEGVGSPETGGLGRYELPCEFWESNLGPLEKQLNR